MAEDENQQNTPASQPEPVSEEIIPQTPQEQNIPVSENVPKNIPELLPEILVNTAETPDKEISQPTENEIKTSQPSPEATAGKAESISEPEPVSEISVDPNNPNITIEKSGDKVTITEVMEKPKSTEPEKPTKNFVRELIAKSRAKKQEKKRAKIDKLFQEITARGKITNDGVEKFLHVSDPTATRYLDILEKEGKIRQVGKTGKHTYYEKI
jgi:hypothetical protein